MIPSALVPVPGHLRTSYGARGKPRDEAGRPWACRLLRTVEELRGKSTTSWRCTAPMALALAELDADIIEAGGSGLRLTEVSREWSFAHAERAKYDRWIAAEQPIPGTRRWETGLMRTTYVARAGETNHGWGAAIDIDAYAIDLPGLTPNARLAAFWKLATVRGFRPVIPEPDVSRPECWHFDHLGPLEPVRARYREAAKADPGRYGQGYSYTAIVGHALTGEWKGGNARGLWVQARLIAHGALLVPDGLVGPKTRAAAAAFGVEFNARTREAGIEAALDEAGIGAAMLAELALSGAA